MEKMAEMVGMSDRSAYHGMIKNKRMKLKYLINLINNAGITSDQIFRSSTKYQQEELVNQANDPKVTIYSCPNCISKQREIDALNKALEAKDELLEKYRGDEKREKNLKDSA
jgi:hypothetical protein